QDYGAPSTFSWSASGAGGAYILRVDAKSSSAPVSAAWGTTLAYQLMSCTDGTLAVSPSSPQTPGTSIELTAAATCPATAEYRFVVHNPDASVTTLRDYGPASTSAWDTTGLAYG